MGLRSPSFDHQFVKELIRARGHKHVSASHQSTFEVTTDDFLTPAGDCIIGIDANRAPADFDPEFVSACQQPTTTIRLTLQVGSAEQRITGQGHPEMSLKSDRSTVVRTSDYVDDRTVAVQADAAAAHIEETIIEDLRAGAELELQLQVNP